MANKRRSSKNRYSKRNLKGGAGGASWAESVYGGASSQQAGGEGNVIAMNNPSALQQPGAITGGRRRKTGGNLTDLAVPAVLLVANQMYKRRGGPTRRSRGSRRRFSRRVRGGADVKLHE